MITDLFISMTMMKISLAQKHNRIHSNTAFLHSAVPQMAQRQISAQDNAKVRPNSVILGEAKQKDNRLSSLSLPKPAENASQKEDEKSQTTKNDDLFVPALTLDSLELALKRANLIVSEHIATSQQQKPKSPTSPETRQILNCSLRETKVLYERHLDKQIESQSENTTKGGLGSTSPIRNTNLEAAFERIRNKLKVELGELEGDLPMHAESIHEVRELKFLFKTRFLN